MFTLATVALAADIPVGPTRPDTTVAQGVQGASSGDVLVIDGGTYPTDAIQFSGRTLTFRASGTGPVVLEATSGASLFRVNGGGIVLEDLVVDGLGARRIVDGNNSDVTLIGTTLRNGSSADTGGLLDVRNGTVDITDSTLTSATAATAGGLVHVAGGSLRLEGSTLSDGSAPLGAAVHVDTTTTVITTTFSGNTGTTGTVACAAGSTCTVDGSRFVMNDVMNGAAIHFAGNGVHTVGETIACGNDGAMLFDVLGGDLTLAESIVFDNAAGAVRFGTTTTGALRDLHLVANVPPAPLAVVAADGTVDISNTVVAYNVASGPAVVGAGTLTASYNLYFDNLTADSAFALEPTELTADPQLVGIATGGCDTDQLVPFDGSPLIDMGDPALLDDDGSRSDIGAFGTSDALPFVDADADGVPEVLDCDDTNADVFPGAVEQTCTGLDEDCDPTTLDDEDADADGVSVCDGDCDDAEPLVAPGLAEIGCTGLDEDCDPTTPDDEDTDADGVSVCDGDCDDTDDRRFPGTPDVLCSGLDEDCDPLTVDAPDVDADGVSICDDDCDDTMASVFPGADEVPYDGIDQDCDGIDLDDVDQDGFLLADDCDDADDGIRPFALEVPDDGIDQDCSGEDATSALTGRYGYRCGCTSTQGGTPFGALFLLVALVRRRRR